MKATEILVEMGKVKSIIGDAARLYSNNEKMAKLFLLECHEQIESNPESFINHFGIKIVNDINSFVSKEES